MAAPELRKETDENSVTVDYTLPGKGTVSLGDRFRSRRRPAMIVTVSHIYDSGDCAVDRNTSRRQQSIRAARLLDPRQYERA